MESKKKAMAMLENLATTSIDEGDDGVDVLGDDDDAGEDGVDISRDEAKSRENGNNKRRRQRKWTSAEMAN